MPQLSPVVGLVVAIVANDWLGLAGEVMLAGQVIVGSILSVGVIVNAHNEEFPCVSHTWMLINVGEVITVPAAGVCNTVNDAGVSQLSENVIPKVDI
jgi:hypothetical protein